MTLHDIVVRGACEHNLRDVDVTIPRRSLSTITGVSGSGKSSLAFDTICQEGQRRYVESLSAYARQFLGRMHKPKVERIDGLSPTLLIDQRTAGRNPRSTVGTITGIWDHLRLLWARLGTPHCPVCGVPVGGRSQASIVSGVLERWPGRRLAVLAPMVRDRKGAHRKDMEGWRLKGYTRLWVDGVEHRLDTPPQLTRQQRHTLELVVDRLRPDPERRGRLEEAVASACALAGGLVAVRVGNEDAVTFSSHDACPEGHGDFPELEPRLFSFNSPHGACSQCEGLGVRRQPDERLVVRDENLSIRDGALNIMNRSGYLSYVRLGPRSLETLARSFDIDLDLAWKDLPGAARQLLMHGSGDVDVTLEWSWSSPQDEVSIRGRDTRPFEGILPAIARHVGRPGFRQVERFLSSRTCPECAGTRLNASARSVLFRDRALTVVAAWTVDEARAYFDGLVLRPQERPVGRPILQELRTRLRFLQDVGVGYLRLERRARSLSGGEAQRVRLATQVGSGLQGVLYVLDEPSIGLHSRDNRRLIRTLKRLRDRGNTVLVVEHDADTILASDMLVDLGPGAGKEGGRLLAAGPVDEVLAQARTPTTDYLTGRRSIPVPSRRRPGQGPRLVVRGATQHNLQHLTVPFPLGCLIAVTGVSGSGKSTLVDQILRRELARRLQGGRSEPGAHEGMDGVEQLDKVVVIDQQPIGRTPRSNPATYTGVMNLVRDVFAACPEAKVRGYAKGRFSFNVKGGRCEDCGGAGVNVVEMQFLPDVEVRCDVCAGRRYNTETLEIQYRGMAIDQVLAMTAAEALEFFRHHSAMARILQTMVDVGLGYVPLGQPSTTLSGGEAQRMKLASQLCRPATGRTLVILDEPTTGLHFADIQVLIEVLQRLVDAGNTVVVVEHNLDVVKCADWVLDLGPEGGDQGGQLVVAGPPEEVAAHPDSHTGRALRTVLRQRVRRPRQVRRKAPAARPPGIDLTVRGASIHNLRRVSVRIPHASLTVVTGPSGSGKTSLAFDTVFAEGQRRYVESLSTYARRFLARMERPPVDKVSGLSPAIAIDQKTAGRNPRSTVGTSTEVHDFLRLLYARVGIPHCWSCGKEIRSFSASAAAVDLLRRAEGQHATIVAPLYDAGHTEPTVLSHPETLTRLAGELSRDGFLRVLLDGELHRLDALPDPASARVVELVVDRIRLGPRRRTRVAEALDLALQRGLGLARVLLEDGNRAEYEARLGCSRCGTRMDGPLSPRMFSFNSHVGACPTCEGLGKLLVPSERLLIDEPDRPLLRGAMTSRVGRFLTRPRGRTVGVLERIAQQLGADLGRPWAVQPRTLRQAVLQGEGLSEPVCVQVERSSEGRSRSYEYRVPWTGLLDQVETWWRSTERDGWWRRSLEQVMESGACTDCQGGRLQPASLAVTVGGKSIRDVGRLCVDEARTFFARLSLQGRSRAIAAETLKEIRNRLSFLHNVGLGYLQLDRAASTLSGGEAQRIRLAAQLGNRLVGVLYVLDEPSIGLHPRDQGRLLATLKDLRDLGNTILVVEHDRDTIEAADHVIDMGPGAGAGGGTVVAACPPATLARHPRSLTAQYLSGRRQVPVPARRRTQRHELVLRGARLHNLARVTARFPVGALTVVTGVSGSGKSSLVTDLLVPAVAARLQGGRTSPKGMTSLSGVRHVERLLVIDQAPLGRSMHSNPATYSGAFDDIRSLFAGTPEARMRGFGPGHFSSNVPGGRCEACQGRGVEIIEMHFLSDVTVRCDACRGLRFRAETLQVQWKGKTIADVLDLEVDAALEVFGNQPRICRRLGLLADVGLGYLKLGQPATTLSGGEAQRVKMAAELGRPDTGKALVVLDEPTTGLHFGDVARLMEVLQRMVDEGNTVVVVEHNVDVIKCADRVIDLGPEGGEGGGRVVVSGTPEEVACCPDSHTGAFLARALKGAPA